ncbi:hypothetical protein CTAYLR_009216 [Chrysophaeum taylorii]|uniref:ADP-ribosylation factor-like protein 3 n=1 Tax=Chrysophaeum taylorii TaxID=2483200 RepID=A0AAD7XJJ7_9STRA|nr:hypothetical protein CTAYLR_009216 [Chrysophaeum taylorii]
MPGLLHLLQKLKRTDDDYKLLILGLDNAGKTTLMKCLSEDATTVAPTQGFNVSQLRHGQYTLNCWDIGGQKPSRAYWPNYFDKTDGLVYVVDSADKARIEETSIELSHIIAESTLNNVPLLVFANKQDLLQALEADDIMDALDLTRIRVRPWRIQPCDARTGAGLREGLEWLVAEINAVE